MILTIIIMVLLIVMHGIFFASDVALATISDSKVEEDAEDGVKQAKKVLTYTQNAKPYQTATQVFIYLTLIINGTVSLDFLTDQILASFSIVEVWIKILIMVVLAFLVLTLHIVFGMLIPKRFAHKNPEKIAYSTIGFVMLMTHLFIPFVSLFHLLSTFFGQLFGLKRHEGERKVTEEDIRTIVEESSKTGSIDEEESEMIQNVFDFSDTTVDEIMTHRTEISALNVKSTRTQLIDFVRKEQYTRYPVYEGNIDHIVGTIHVKDLLKFIDKPEEKFSLKQLIRPPYFVPESKKTAELFREMQKQKNHIAVVLDEYGGTAGIVTIEDLIEEIVGNISDEYDEDEELIKQIDEKTYEMNGLTSINDVEDLLEADLPVEDYDTISGFILGQLGRFPDEDEAISVAYHGYSFDVIGVDQKIITKVRITRLENSQVSDDEKED